MLSLAFYYTQTQIQYPIHFPKSAVPCFLVYVQIGLHSTAHSAHISTITFIEAQMQEVDM